MSTYQVLARKWRPHNFQTIVGQDHVVTALTRALAEKRLHHAYLFTGTRGVGKTTISRIFAKALNCQGADGKGDVTPEPCGVCPACRAIDEGRFSDYIEMDAASNRSVEDMTALLERAMYAPTEGRYKVYMIDEVHMLSTTAFNAMLKTLEEPPEYVKFILATTDPQKVPITVLSRCLQFNLRNMTPSGIVSHMSHILDTEGVAYETGALRLLAQGARGSMRDGLSLLDQAIAYCASGVTEREVRDMLGMSGTELLSELFDRLLAGDARGLMGVADEMLAQSLSFAQVLRDLAGVVHRAALVQRVPEAVSEDDPECALVRRLARDLTQRLPCRFEMDAQQVERDAAAQLARAAHLFEGAQKSGIVALLDDELRVGGIAAQAQLQHLLSQGGDIFARLGGDADICGRIERGVRAEIRLVVYDQPLFPLQRVPNGGILFRERLG